MWTFWFWFWWTSFDFLPFIDGLTIVFFMKNKRLIMGKNKVNSRPISASSNFLPFSDDSWSFLKISEDSWRQPKISEDYWKCTETTKDVRRIPRFPRRISTILEYIFVVIFTYLSSLLAEALFLGFRSGQRHPCPIHPHCNHPLKVNSVRSIRTDR